MTIGKKIKYYRKNKKISQEKLAEKIGISRQAVSKWESDKSVPSTDNLIYISEILDVTVEELTSDNHGYKDKEFDKLGFKVGYSLSAAAAMFFYGFRNIDTRLKSAYVVLGFIGAIVLSIFTYRLYSIKTRKKIIRYNLIYLIIINILGILSKYYGGIIAMILIVLSVPGYEKLLKTYDG